jgi:hypothetical protein
MAAWLGPHCFLASKTCLSKIFFRKGSYFPIAHYSLGPAIYLLHQLLSGYMDVGDCQFDWLAYRDIPP